MSLAKWFVLIFLVFVFSGGNFMAAQNYDENFIKQKAEEKIQAELHKILEEKLGRDIAVEDYMQVLDYLANGEFNSAKGLMSEKAMAELLTYSAGAASTSVIGAGWSFDKWVWNSVQNWADNENKEMFHENFLKARIAQWQRENRFSGNKYDPEFRKKLETDFNEWCENNYESIVAIKLYADKNKFFQDFKNQMWEKILQSIRDVGQQNEIRRLALQAKRNIEVKRLQYEKQIRQQVQGTKPSQENEQAIVNEFRQLWPQLLKKIYQGEKLTINANAVYIGPNQYHCSYTAQSATGDNIRSLEVLKRDIRDMKSYLGIK